MGDQGGGHAEQEQRGLGEQEEMGCIRECLGAGREADP